jgi:hypothetical protein
MLGEYPHQHDPSREDRHCFAGGRFPKGKGPATRQQPDPEQRKHHGRHLEWVAQNVQNAARQKKCVEKKQRNGDFPHSRFNQKSISI